MKKKQNCVNISPEKNVENQMFANDWNRLYRNEFVKAMRHVRRSSRSYTCVVYMAIFGTIIPTLLNRRPLFYCYFPFETRYEYSSQGYVLLFYFVRFYRFVDDELM